MVTFLKDFNNPKRQIQDHLVNLVHLRDGDLPRNGASPRDGNHHREYWPSCGPSGGFGPS